MSKHFVFVLYIFLKNPICGTMTLKSWQRTNITPFYRWKNWIAKRLTTQDKRAGAELDHSLSHLASGIYYVHLITNLHDKIFLRLIDLSNNRYTHCGAENPTPELKSHALFCWSRPGTPVNHIFTLWCYRRKMLEAFTLIGHFCPKLNPELTSAGPN